MFTVTLSVVDAAVSSELRLSELLSEYPESFSVSFCGCSFVGGGLLSPVLTSS